MAKTRTYYLNVVDIMRGSALSLNYETKKELADAYKRYRDNTDYKVLSVHSITVESDVILTTELENILNQNQEG